MNNTTGNEAAAPTEILTAMDEAAQLYKTQAARQEIYNEVWSEGGVQDGLYQAHECIDKIRHNGGSIDDAAKVITEMWLQQMDRHRERLINLRYEDGTHTRTEGESL